MPRAKLMIPGPVDVFEDTLEAMSRPIIPHYGKEWIEIYWETVGLLKQVFQTKNDVYILTSSGSGAIDAALGSLLYTGEKILLIENGVFAWRTQQVAEGYGIKVETLQFPWGKAADPDPVRDYLRQHSDIRCLAVIGNETSTGVVNPVKELSSIAHEFDIPIFVDGISAIGGVDMPVDEYGVDLCATVANKSLETPAGLGLLSISARAWEIIQRKKDDRHHGWYLNLSAWREYMEDPAWRDWHPYPITLPTNNILGLRASLRRILFEETLPGHFARFARARDVLRAGLRNVGFEMLADDSCASPTVTSVLKRPDMTVDEFLGYMEAKHGFMLAGSVRQLAGKIFRVSHMGKASTDEYLLPCLLGIEDFLRHKGISVPVGASLVGYADQAEGIMKERRSLEL